MGAQEQNPGLFRLPSVFVRTAETLGRHFNLPAQYLVACLPAVVGTAAGGCRLETDIWSQAISPALDLAFCLPEDERLRTAVGHILKPLQEIQGQYWSVLQSREVVGNQARPPAPEWDSQPLVLLDNPAAGQLAETARQSQGSPMLVLYDEAGWKPIVKAARSRAKIDLVLLQRGWEGQSCAAPESGGIAGHLSVGCLALCRPTSWSRALTSNNALLAKLASQFLLIDAAPDAKELRPERLDLTRSLRPWRELIYRIVAVCHRVGRNPIQLSPEAYQSLMDFWRQNMGEGAWLTPEAKLFQRNVTLIAAKIALVFHLVSEGPKQRVSVEVMKPAIGMAQWLARSTSQTIDHLVQEAREASLRHQAEDMLQRIGQESPLRWLALRRTYHLQDIDLHQPALDLLLAKGQAAYDDKGRLVLTNAASDPIV